MCDLPADIAKRAQEIHSRCPLIIIYLNYFKRPVVLSVAAATVVVVAAVVVAVANDKNDHQKNYPSTVAVTKCVTHKMCLLINIYYLNASHSEPDVCRRSVFEVFSIYNTYYNKKLVRATCPKIIFLKLFKKSTEHY